MPCSSHKRLGCKQFKSLKEPTVEPSGIFDAGKINCIVPYLI